MTAVDSTSCPTDTAIFEPFQWHRDEVERAKLPGRAIMSFATKAQDISTGAKTILEILEADELAEDADRRRLLNEAHRGHLLRMVITSLGMLGETSDEIMEWAFEHHTPEGRKEAAAMRKEMGAFIPV